jgi:hypothetical protein
MSPDNPSPVGDSSDLLKPIPVPPEIIELAKRTFNAEETIEAIREIRRTGGLKFEEIIDELEALPSEPNEAQTT